MPQRHSPRNLTAPHTEIIAFIDIDHENFRVEAFSHTLGATKCEFITSRCCRAAKTHPASAHDLRNAALLIQSR